MIYSFDSDKSVEENFKEAFKDCFSTTLADRTAHLRNKYDQFSLRLLYFYTIEDMSKMRDDEITDQLLDDMDALWWALTEDNQDWIVNLERRAKEVPHP